MDVNSLNSGNNYVSQVQPQPQTPVERAAEEKKDKDRDEANKAAAVNAPVQPTVNTSGQKVGAVINVQA
ncbi:MAG: hypothetical protein KKH12_01205 [Gammaproteobacteria bacterium]|nr:hypothetical protein [Gammaproteobacteria bacterium]MBU1480269.1 hypothetical protein [Gammaproteobacteria bacterium]